MSAAPFAISGNFRLLLLLYNVTFADLGVALGVNVNFIVVHFIGFRRVVVDVECFDGLNDVDYFLSAEKANISFADDNGEVVLIAVQLLDGGINFHVFTGRFHDAERLGESDAGFALELGAYIAVDLVGIITDVDAVACGDDHAVSNPLN